MEALFTFGTFAIFLEKRAFPHLELVRNDNSDLFPAVFRFLFPSFSCIFFLTSSLRLQLVLVSKLSLCLIVLGLLSLPPVSYPFLFLLRLIFLRLFLCFVLNSWTLLVKLAEVNFQILIWELVNRENLVSFLYVGFFLLFLFFPPLILLIVLSPLLPAYVAHVVIGALHHL